MSCRSCCIVHPIFTSSNLPSFSYVSEAYSGVLGVLFTPRSPLPSLFIQKKIIRLDILERAWREGRVQKTPATLGYALETPKIRIRNRSGIWAGIPGGIGVGSLGDEERYPIGDRRPVTTFPPPDDGLHRREGKTPWWAD